MRLTIFALFNLILNTIGRGRKIWLIALALIVSLPFVLYLILLSNTVQLFLINKTTQFLKNELGLVVSIGKINFRPINFLKLEDVYVEDLDGDTLLYVNSLTAGIEHINISIPELYFNKVEVDSLKFHMIADSADNYNLLKIIDLIYQPDSIPNPDEPAVRVFSNLVQVKRAEYILKDQNAQRTPELNSGYIKLQKLNITAQPFNLHGDTIKVSIKELKTTDHCGLAIKDIAVDFSFEPEAMKFEHFCATFGKSDIKSDYVRLNYLTDTALSNFIDEVSFDAKLQSSYISTDDLAWFAPVLQSFGIDAKVEGQITGPISNIQADDLKLEINDSTILQTSFTLKGLPEVDKIYFDIDIANLTTTYTQLTGLAILTDTLGQNVIPSELSSLSKINYKGAAMGNLYNIASIGGLKTNLGNISYDISYATLDTKQINFNGNVNLIDFELGKITSHQPMLDKIDAKFNINTLLDTDNSFTSKISSTVNYIDLEKYRYHNIEIEGELTDKYFNGNLAINDSCAKIDFAGRFEYNTPNLQHKFILNLQHLNLYAIGFSTDRSSSVQFDMTADLQGIDPDSIIGTINLYDIIVTHNNQKANLINLDLQFDRSGISKTLLIKSAFIDILMSGQYSYNNISDVLSDAVKQYFPAMAWSDNKIDNNDPTNINLKIELHNIQPIVNLLDTSLTISNNGYLDFKYRAAGKQLAMKGRTSDIAYNGQTIKNISISGYNDLSKIIANVSADYYYYYEGLSLKNISLNTIIENNQIAVNVNWNNYNRTDTTNYSGYLSTSISFPEVNKLNIVNIDILSSNVVISDTTWSITPSVIKINGNEIEINNFSISNRSQYLKIDGKVSESPTDTLYVKAQKVNVGILNIMLKSRYDMSIEGLLTSDIVATNLYDKPFVLAQVELEKLKYNNQTIGNTTISSTWDPLLEMIHIDWVSTVKNYEVLYISGDYSPYSSMLNFRLFVDRLDLSVLNPHLKGIIHDLSGQTTAEIIIKGTIESPKIEGVVILDRTNFIVDYTKTRYQITDWIDIMPNKIEFSDLLVTDDNNNYLIVSGNINHKNFDNIGLDIKFNAHNFMFLNTLERDNDTFYGTVYVSGNGELNGSTDKLNISLGVKTEPNTRLFIPLNSGATASQIDYITFKTTKTQQLPTLSPKTTDTVATKNNTDINLKMNIEVTPNAEIQIIFDPAIGDIIKAKGSSNLAIFMSPNNDLEMYGDYIISEGDYLFTLQDIFQKRFAIAKGSNITWSGDPANANIDIDAVYKVRRATLYDLTFNPNDENSRITADAHLMMTGTFVSPNINFKVTLPASAEEAQEQLNSLQSDEISKQVISLLVLSRFQPLPGAVKITETSGPSSIESNASELLSNQVSNWLSQISRSFDIGFNYTPGGETSAQEYELAVSTQILNNRVTINTNFGMGGQQIESGTRDGTKIASDFEMEVKLDKRGKIMFKGYRLSDNNLHTHPKQGAGIFYREEFNTLRELWDKFFKKK